MNLEQYHNEIASRPIRHFNINLTNQCNLRCYYCFTEHNPKNLSFQTMKDIVDFAYNQWIEKDKLEDTLNFTFFGGEPLLRYNDIIVPSVEYIKNKFQENNIPDKYWPGFSITTNGTLLTEDKLQFFRKNNFSLLLSIDGNKKSQNLNRPKINGEGSFDDIVPIIPKLLELFPNTTFRSTVTPKTVDKIIDNYFFAEDQNFNSYFLIPNECEPWTEEEKTMLTYQMGLMTEIIYDSISNKIAPLYFSPLMKAIENILIPIPFTKSPHRCGLGTASVGVSVDGKLSGCQEYSTFIDDEDLFCIGNVYDGIDENKHLNLLNKYLEKEHIQPINGDCNENCICYDICNRNVCPSKNYTLHQDMNINSEIICHWKKIIFWCAENFLIRAAKENNLEVQKYLKFYLPKGVKL